FQAVVDERAARLAKAATLAIAMIKDAVRRGYDLPLDEALEIEARNFARAALSDDAAIGIMSFLAKQEPEFKGSKLADSAAACSSYAWSRYPDRLFAVSA